MLIPGWATDWRIFGGLKLDYNYLLTTRLSASDFNGELLSQLEQLKINKVAVLGFSLGGFLAAEFASRYPEKIIQLILLGVRKRHDGQLLANIKREIQARRRTWLYKFYLNCFSRADTEGRAWFKKHLLKEYMDKLSLDELIPGLDYLASHALHPEALVSIRDIRIFHGNDDMIAPVQEALEIKSDLPRAKFTFLADSGHLFFLSRDFRERFYGG